MGKDDDEALLSVFHSSNFYFGLGFTQSVSVRVSVCLFVFKYLRYSSLVFSEILHEVRGQSIKKVT